MVVRVSGEVIVSAPPEGPEPMMILLAPLVKMPAPPGKNRSGELTVTLLAVLFRRELSVNVPSVASLIAAEATTPVPPLRVVMLPACAAPLLKLPAVTAPVALLMVTQGEHPPPPTMLGVAEERLTEPEPAAPCAAIPPMFIPVPDAAPAIIVTAPARPAPVPELLSVMAAGRMMEPAVPGVKPS